MPSLTSEHERVGTLFQDAQSSLVQHRRLWSAALAQLKANPEAFSRSFISHVGRVLTVKKSEPCGDRVIKFAAGFVQHTQERAFGGDCNDAALQASIGAFTMLLMQTMMPGTDAKDKVVRFRVVQLLAYCVNAMIEIDDDLYNEVTARFLRRLNDKEASIRQHAVIGLAKLQSSDEGGEGDSEGDEIVEALLNLLQHDPSSEVRRAVLLNLEQTRITLPYILERARDTDSVNRRMVYSRCLKQLGSFKYLSIKKREKLLSWGLQDRDESVVAAAARMFAHDWLETAENNIIDLLERLDVVSSKIAPRALRVFFQERPEACAQIDMIDSEIWQNLTPESALLARVFNEHGHAKGNEHLDVESKLPETSQLAAYIESQISQMLHCREEGEELRFSEHAFMVEQLFRIALTGDFADEMGRRRMFPLMRAVLTDIRMPDNIIKMAVKVLSCISGSSESYLVGIIMEILSDIEDSLQPRPQQQESSHRSSFGGSEVGSHHAGDSSNSSFHSAQSAIASSPAPGSSGATPVSAARGKRMLTPVSDVSHEESPDITEAITIRLRCLLIVRQTLEGLRKGPQDNSQLLNLFESIIVPCVRDHNAAVREHGLQCLGLYASLSEKETVENFALFAHCLAKGHESLQIVAIETITDLLVCHGAGILQRSDIGITELQFLNLLARALTADELPSLQATTVVAVCKLLLLNLLPSSELLEILMFVYFDPATAQNLLLRQALSYFFPVYCFSAAAHQALAAKAVIPAFHKLAKLALQLEADDGAPSGAAGAGDDERMTPLPSILAQMVDWTNPARLAHQEAEADAANADQMSNPHLATHLDMALAMVRQIQASRYREERNALCMAMQKLSFNRKEERCSELRDQLTEMVEGSVASLADAGPRNALQKLLSSLQ